MRLANTEALLTRTGEVLYCGDYFPKQLIPRSVNSLFKPEAVDTIKNALANSGSQETQIDLVHNRHCFIVRLRPQFYDGQEAFLLRAVMLRDWKKLTGEITDVLTYMQFARERLCVLDCAGFILHANEAFLIAHQQKTESLVGKPIGSVMDGDLAESDSTKEEENQESRASLHDSTLHTLSFLTDIENRIIARLCWEKNRIEDLAHLGEQMAFRYGKPTLLLLDFRGDIIYSTLGAEELLGSQNSLQGHHFVNYLAEANDRRQIALSIGSQKPLDRMKTRVHKANGEYHSMELELIEASRLGGMAELGIFFVTDKEQDSKRDHAIQEQYESILTANPWQATICYQRINAVPVYVSPQIAELSGYSLMEWQQGLGLLLTVIPEEDAAKLKIWSDDPGYETMESLATSIRRQDGRKQPVLLSFRRQLHPSRIYIFIQMCEPAPIHSSFFFIQYLKEALNQESRSDKALERLLELLCEEFKADEVFLRIYDAITGNSLTVLCSSEDAELDPSWASLMESNLSLDVLENTMQTLYNEGRLITRVPIIMRDELCAHLDILEPDTDILKGWNPEIISNLLGLLILLWRAEYSIRQEANDGRILVYGLERMLEERLDATRQQLIGTISTNLEPNPALDVVVEQLKGISSLISELAIFASTEKISPLAEYIELDELFAEIGQLFIPRLSENNGILHVRRGLPFVNAPRLTLKYAISRLLDFTLRYRIPAEPLRVELGAELEEKGVIIRLICNIQPFAEDELRWLFAPFYQLSSQAKEAELGLAVVSRMVETIGGVISVERKADMLEFTIMLRNRI